MRFAPSRRLPPTLAALAVALAVGLPAPACALRGGPGGHARGHAADRGSAGRAGRSAAGALAARPYMGWDTYFAFGGAYSEATVLRQASEMISLGLRGLGYRYVWLDVGWWQGARTAGGQISVNHRQWPHGLAWLTGTLHAAGLLAGIYTDAGH